MIDEGKCRGECVRGSRGGCLREEGEKGGERGELERSFLQPSRQSFEWKDDTSSRSVPGSCATRSSVNPIPRFVKAGAATSGKRKRARRGPSRTSTTTELPRFCVAGEKAVDVRGKEGIEASVGVLLVSI